MADDSWPLVTSGLFLLRAAASSILSIVYDIPTVSSPDDPTVTNINMFMDVVVEYASPGNYLVEFFPWMLYIPASLAKWKRKAKAGNIFFSKLFMGMFHDVETRIVSLCFLFAPFLSSMDYSEFRR